MTTALEGGRVRGQRHAPAALYAQERPGTHCTGGWVGPTTGLDRCGKSRIGIRSPDRPARSQSLYRLRYPAHEVYKDRLNLADCGTFQSGLRARDFRRIFWDRPAKIGAGGHPFAKDDGRIRKEKQ